MLIALCIRCCARYTPLVNSYELGCLGTFGKRVNSTPSPYFFDIVGKYTLICTPTPTEPQPGKSPYSWRIVKEKRSGGCWGVECSYRRKDH